VGRTRTGTGGTNQNGTKLLSRRFVRMCSSLCLLLEHMDLFIQLRDETLQVVELVGGRHCVSVVMQRW